MFIVFLVQKALKNKNIHVFLKKVKFCLEGIVKSSIFASTRIKKRAF